MTPIQEMMDHLIKYEYFIGDDLILKYKELLRKERQMVSDAMMHALDEDGHTGEWRVKFINDYLNDRGNNK